MARWMAIGSFVLVALVTLVSIRDGKRAADAKGLGGACESTHGCQRGTSCIDQEGVMAGQCSSSCNDNAACSDRFGAAVLCLGADLCARACDDASDCPADTACNVYGWCERPAVVH
jgi:hypothetical protein